MAWNQGQGTVSEFVDETPEEGWRGEGLVFLRFRSLERVQAKQEGMVQKVWGRGGDGDNLVGERRDYGEGEVPDFTGHRNEWSGLIDDLGVNPHPFSVPCFCTIKILEATGYLYQLVLSAVKSGLDVEGNDSGFWRFRGISEVGVVELFWGHSSEEGVFGEWNGRESKEDQERDDEDDKDSEKVQVVVPWMGLIAAEEGVSEDSIVEGQDDFCQKEEEGDIGDDEEDKEDDELGKEHGVVEYGTKFTGGGLGDKISRYCIRGRGGIISSSNRVHTWSCEEDTRNASSMRVAVTWVFCPVATVTRHGSGKDKGANEGQVLMSIRCGRWQNGMIQGNQSLDPVEGWEGQEFNGDVVLIRGLFVIRVEGHDGLSAEEEELLTIKFSIRLFMYST
ncbi:hypothetical protein B0H21DRAFT_709802 [Amylocystis lapponica]|nr:hypothetical protein B0H21DRAFT_709802 [Amylocystis lapponica]